VRTENDTWDITTSVGSTALFVAAARALEAQKPDPLAVDPYAELFCRAVGGEWADVLDGKAPDNRLSSEFGEHFVNYQGARTKYFDAYFTKAAQAGVRQIVILAAGLDSRADRLAWPAGTVVFELDQPRVLEFKREVLAEHGATPTAERRQIAVDLRDDWPQALTNQGFDPSKPSAWIAEGLLIYLPATTQEQLFTGIDKSAAPGSQGRRGASRRRPDGRAIFPIDL
jgi:methyltransferase (TIGR00027 family)